MTDQQRIQNLELKFDRCQHGLHELTARVDAMAAQMTSFCAEMQGHIVQLLQQQGHDIKISEGEEPKQ